MKSYTDIPQSKKLAEILPIESADMCWQYQKDRWVGEPDYEEFPRFEHAIDKRDIPCWSLASLLGVLPKIHGLKPILDLEECSIQYSGIDLYITASNPVDVCYSMIINLNELNLL